MKFTSKISYVLCTTAFISIILCAVLWFTLKARETRTSYEWADNFTKVQVEQTVSSNNNYNLPTWVQGDWAVTTPYGSFGIKINGNKMWIVDFDGTMREGSFHYDYEQHTIYPDFEDTFYELDLSNHKISAGGGYYFHRI